MGDRPQLTADDLAYISSRDKFTCHVCTQGWDPRDPWEIDHVVPVARDGRHTLRNLRLAHRSCNQTKATA